MFQILFWTVDYFVKVWVGLFPRDTISIPHSYLKVNNNDTHHIILYVSLYIGLVLCRQIMTLCDVCVGDETISVINYDRSDYWFWYHPFFQEH